MSVRGRAWAGLALALAIASCDSKPPTNPDSGEVRVIGVQPASGSTFGGTTVTINGAGFTAGATVTIGGTAATSVSVFNDSTLTAVTPQHAAGAATVNVTSGGRTGTLAAAYTFVTPSPTSNTPPTIQSLTAQGTRPNQPAAMADLSEAIVVTANVTDVETPSPSLTYEWTATVGAFEGTGAIVNWRAPATLSGTPRNETLTLTVIERYVTADGQGLPVNQEHRITRTVTVRVHDSIKEVGDLAREFLLLFSDSSVPPPQVIAGFSDTCRGKADELGDVEGNRCEFTIVSSFIGPATVAIGFGGVCPVPNGPQLRSDACVQVPARWASVVKPNAQLCRGNMNLTSGITEGVDWVSAVYVNGQWRLCDSLFRGVNGQVSKFKR